MELEKGTGTRRESAGALFYDTNLYIVFGVALIAVLRADSVTPAFPEIARVFDLPVDSVGLLITLFALPSVFLTPVLGVLADRWGRKRILGFSLLLFGLAGGACSLVRNFNLLLVLRFVQGVGAAPLSMLNITLVADRYAGRERTAAMGYNSTVRSTGSTLYPLLGGGLAALGWYCPFALSLLAVPVGLLVLFVLQSPEPKGGPGLVAYLGQTWNSLRSGQVLGLFVAGCIVFIIMFGAYLAYYPFMLQDRFAASPPFIGLLVSGRAVINALIASQMSCISPICPPSMLLKVSFCLYSLVFFFFPWATAWWGVILLTLVLGIAEGLYWPSNHLLLGRMAPLEHRAGFMAVNDMVLKLGQAVGPLLMGAVFVRRGVDGVFTLAAGLCVVALCLTAFLLKPVRGPSG